MKHENFWFSNSSLGCSTSILNMRLDELLGAASLVIFVASLAFSPLRYISYTVPIFSLIVALANQKIVFPDLVKPYLLLVVVSILLAPIGNAEGAKDTYLIICGLSVALVGYRLSWSWIKLFFVCIVGYAIYIFLEIKSRGFASLILDIYSSKSTFESSFAFVFGMLSVWAAYDRKLGRFILSALVVAMTLKRVVILAVLVCCFLTFMPRTIARKLLTPSVMILANFSVLGVILLYGSGALDQYIHILTGTSANAFGMGRRILYASVVTELLQDPWRFFLIGAGPGEAYSMVKSGAEWLGKENLHSDVLKILIEYGLTAFVVFIYALYRSSNFIVLLFACYTNVLLVTDNTLIYPFYIFFLTYIVNCLLQQNASE